MSEPILTDPFQLKLLADDPSVACHHAYLLAVAHQLLQDLALFSSFLTPPPPRIHTNTPGSYLSESCCATILTPQMQTPQVTAYLLPFKSSMFGLNCHLFSVL